VTEVTGRGESGHSRIFGGGRRLIGQWEFPRATPECGWRGEVFGGRCARILLLLPLGSKHSTGLVSGLRSKVEEPVVGDRVPLMKANSDSIDAERTADLPCRSVGRRCSTEMSGQEKGAAMPRDREVGISGPVEVHPIAELLACPPETSHLLASATESISCHPGEVVFEQNGECRGLYVLVSGLFQRRAERMESSLNLGVAHSGELIELAAVLGDHHHTFTLAAQSAGQLLLLPASALEAAFGSFPPLRMHLLEEQAREVSRAYALCSLVRPLRKRSSEHSVH